MQGSAQLAAGTQPLARQASTSDGTNLHPPPVPPSPHLCHTTTVSIIPAATTTAVPSPVIRGGSGGRVRGCLLGHYDANIYTARSLLDPHCMMRTYATLRCTAPAEAEQALAPAGGEHRRRHRDVRGPPRPSRRRWCHPANVCGVAGTRSWRKSEAANTATARMHTGGHRALRIHGAVSQVMRPPLVAQTRCD